MFGGFEIYNYFPVRFPCNAHTDSVFFLAFVVPFDSVQTKKPDKFIISIKTQLQETHDKMKQRSLTTFSINLLFFLVKIHTN